MSRRDGWVRGLDRRRVVPPQVDAAPAEEPATPITRAPIVPYVPARCPSCGEVAEVRDYGTRTMPTHVDRYHQCRQCGTKFVSRELLHRMES